MDNFSNGLKNRIKNVKQTIIFADIAMTILGVLLIFFPSQSTDIICRVVGALLCLWGLMILVSYFIGDRPEIFDSFAFVQSAALLGFGIYFLVNPSFLVAFFTVVLAIILFVCGVMKLQYALDFARLKTNGWWIQIIAAALIIAGGVIVFVNPFGAAETLMIFIGIALVVSGIWDLITVLYISRVIKTAGKLLQTAEETAAASADAVDVEFKEEN